MQFGMTFSVDMYDFEKGEELHVITMPGDYIRMAEWAGKNLDGDAGSEAVTNLRRNFANVWFALERRGKLAEMGLPEELDVDAVDAMACRFSIYVNEMEASLLPSVQERAQ